jgi:hypothetical protein
MQAQIDKIREQLEGCSQAMKNAGDLLNDYKIDETEKKFDEIYENIIDDLSDQLKKTRSNEFEIAVIGREKAGKSSLLNAWIGFDLLPSERNRCTYTTTEIRSCPSENEQKYLIEYFTSEEFNLKVSAQYSQVGNDHADFKALTLLAQQELEEIEKYRDEISSYLDREEIVVNFKSFDEVRDQLKSAISSPGK